MYIYTTENKSVVVFVGRYDEQSRQEGEEKEENSKLLQNISKIKAET